MGRGWVPGAEGGSQGPRVGPKDQGVALMTFWRSKRAIFSGAAIRAIASTPESMRQTPRLPASIGHSSE